MGMINNKTLRWRMWMIAIYWQTLSPSRSAWFAGWWPTVLSLHSSNKLGEISQRLCLYDSTIDNIIVIITTIMIITIMKYY